MGAVFNHTHGNKLATRLAVLKEVLDLVQANNGTQLVCMS
jgi:hypothetical protein